MLRVGQRRHSAGNTRREGIQIEARKHLYCRIRPVFFSADSSFASCPPIDFVVFLGESGLKEGQ